MKFSDNDLHLVHLSIKIFFFLLVLLTSLFSREFLRHSCAFEGPQTENYMEQGLRCFQYGDFGKAIQNYSSAAVLYDEAENLKDMCNALIQEARSYQYIGQYKKSLEILDKALCLAEKTGDGSQVASALGSMGNACIYTGAVDRAETLLKKGLALAEEEEDYQAAAAILNNMGNMYVFKGLYTDAIVSYKTGIDHAGQAEEHALIAHLLSNLAFVFFKEGKYKEAKRTIGEAFNKYLENADNKYLEDAKCLNFDHLAVELASEYRQKTDPLHLEDSLQQASGSFQWNALHDKAVGLINIAQTCREISKYLPKDASELKAQAYEALRNAIRVAESIKDHRSASYALGYLGRIYEDEGRFEEALQLTRRALFAAQQVDAPESLYLWEWQIGRLFKAQGKTEDAILSYKDAVDTLQSIRNEVSANCATCKGSFFHESVEPVYFELADMLLQQAAFLEGNKEADSLLIEARETIELLKTAELRNYFQDSCLGQYQSKAKRLDSISGNTAVLYIIPFPDRLELLLSLPEGMKRFTAQVDRETLTDQVRLFRRRLEKRTTREYLEQAQRLYDWLIRPLEAEIFSKNIHTLVFVPDGAMRNIPMAALHDGGQFLIKKCALANTLGLNLTDPRPIKRETIHTLLAGLTEPVQGFPALENVELELRSIKDIYEGTLLLNHDLLISNIKKELEHIPYNVVHIASHGEFRGDVKQTYILAWDDRITMDHLDRFMRASRFRERPVELLTLSACQTAAGDDRAALGLAGVAVKAGARGAVATLWHINDKACSGLIVEFYKQLQDPSVSKAKALQTAQLKLLGDKRYEHPCYWSPFLMIGNWL